MNTKIAYATTLAALLLTGVGCASSPEQNDDERPSSDFTSGGESTSTYAVSCDGKVSPLGVTVAAVAPQCMGGEPGTRGCGGQADVCAPQQVAFSYVKPGMRCVSNVYEWNGTACVAHATSGVDGALRCAGKDCLSLYADEATCESAHTGCNGN